MLLSPKVIRASVQLCISTLHKNIECIQVCHRGCHLFQLSPWEPVPQQIRIEPNCVCGTGELAVCSADGSGFGIHWALELSKVLSVQARALTAGAGLVKVDKKV
jgi:hypothetical protein